MIFSPQNIPTRNTNVFYVRVILLYYLDINEYHSKNMNVKELMNNSIFFFPNTDILIPTLIYEKSHFPVCSPSRQEVCNFFPFHFCIYFKTI